ncbi:Serine/threonine protein kinase [Eubacterium ruminantium]|nr:Serine/threonine protein kinase [Eubacterium ruminantium]
MAELKRRCLNCMKEFDVLPEYVHDNAICPYCGFLENTKPKIIYHLFPGTVLMNRYIIGTVLGAGGFGVTYKAWDSVLNIVVAIKEHYPTQFIQRVPGTKEVIVYSGEKEEDYQNSLLAFLEEARNMAKFDHPNIVHVLTFFEENNTAYIVMEYLDGISLKKYLEANNGKLEYGDIDYVFLPVMEGLKAIHNSNIIHRDLNPSNIMLLNRGGVKIFDFGAAKFSDGESEKTREIVLTPGYAPPEQYQSKSVQGPWTDVYALAATLYRALTGKTPTESVNRLPEEVAKNKDILIEPKKLEPSIPDYLNNTILKGMAIEPKLRFRSVEEFERAYKRIKPPPPPRCELIRRRIKRAVSIAAVILVIGIGAFVAYSMFKGKRDTSLKKANIEMWIPYGDDMTEETAKEYGESLVSFFMEQKDNRRVSIDIVAIPEASYEEKLEKAAKSGNMPALFISTDAGDEVMKKAASLENVLTGYTLKNCSYINKYSNEIKNSKKMPSGFYVPAVYVRRMSDVDINTVNIDSIDELKKHKGFIADEDYIDIIAKTLNVSQKEIKDKSEDGEKALQDFSDEKVTYYLASTREYQKVTSKLPGNCEMHMYITDTVYGRFDEYWSIGSGLNEAETKAAETVLKYMFFDNVQQQLYISGTVIMPVNDNTFSTSLIDVFGRFDIVKEINEKLDFSMSFDN